MFDTAGANAEAPEWLGVEVRPGSKSTAKQHWGFQGSWESLLSPRKQSRIGSTRCNKIQDRRRAFRRRSPRKRKLPEVSRAEFSAKAQETGRGSLSICIVATESRVTHPREPVSSEGGCRVAEPPLATRLGLCAQENVSLNRRRIVLGTNPHYEEPDALIALVRFCGGRRPAFGPGGPIPDPATRTVVRTTRVLHSRRGME